MNTNRLVWKSRLCTSLFSGSGLMEPRRILRTSASSSRKNLKLDSKLPVTCLPLRRGENSNFCDSMWEEKAKYVCQTHQMWSLFAIRKWRNPVICSDDPHFSSLFNNSRFVVFLKACVLLPRLWTLKCGFSFETRPVLISRCMSVDDKTGNIYVVIQENEALQLSRINSSSSSVDVTKEHLRHFHQTCIMTSLSVTELCNLSYKRAWSWNVTGFY